MRRRIQLVVPADAAGQRLDVFLSRGDAAIGLGAISRSAAQRLIDAKAVRINGAPTRAAARLRGGESLSVHLAPPQPAALAPVAMPLEVLFEDAHLLAVAKPAGLTVHPGAGTRAPTLVHGLLAHCTDLSGIGGVARPGIVHRLDRDTSGVLVVAKHDRAHQQLARQFAQRSVDKQYWALCWGVPSPAAARIETFYGRHPIHRRRFTARHSSGRRARTDYRVLAAQAGVASLQLGLGTGRTHQLRVHLAERGHPLLGDPLYGGRRRPQSTLLAAALADLPGQALHAWQLRLCHPDSGVPLHLCAPLPPALVQLAAAAELPLPAAGHGAQLYSGPHST